LGSPILIGFVMKPMVTPWRKIHKKSIGCEITSISLKGTAREQVCEYYLPFWQGVV